VINRRYLLGQRTLHPELWRDYGLLSLWDFEVSRIIEGFILKALKRKENVWSLHGSVPDDLSGFLQTSWGLVCFFAQSAPSSKCYLSFRFPPWGDGAQGTTCTEGWAGGVRRWERSSFALEKSPRPVMGRDGSGLQKCKKNRNL